MYLSWSSTLLEPLFPSDRTSPWLYTSVTTGRMSVCPSRAPTTKVWHLTAVWWRRFGSPICFSSIPSAPSSTTPPQTTWCWGFTPMGTSSTASGTNKEGGRWCSQSRIGCLRRRCSCVFVIFFCCLLRGGYCFFNGKTSLWRILSVPNNRIFVHRREKHQNTPKEKLWKRHSKIQKMKTDLFSWLSHPKMRTNESLSFSDHDRQTSLDRSSTLTSNIVPGCSLHLWNSWSCSL